jgi:molybdopterin synthase catalytic subunit
MGTVSVRLFARIAEVAGTRETELETGEGLRVRDVLPALEQRYPGVIAMRSVLRYAVNREFVSEDRVLRDGDEVAIIPPVSGGDAHFEVTDQPLEPERLVEAVSSQEAGAVLLFYGVVRDNNLGRRVDHLVYDAYPEMATGVMAEIAGEAREKWDLTDVAVHHRTGRLEIGETSLLVAIASAHRREAFEAGLWLVDRFKEVVPVWKKEVFEGGEEWIEGERPGEL